MLAALGRAPAVIALDNAETPWEADTLATEELFAHLAAVPEVALVASLRGGERPGGPSWGPSIHLRSMGPSDARRLFLSVAGERLASAELDPLLAEMGGVPLAVELLAHAAEGEPDLAGLATRWRAERVTLLAKGSADHRLLSVAVSLETSWGGPLMTEAARRLLSMLGVLPDGVAHPDLGVLVGGRGPGAANVLRRRGLAFDEGERLRTFPPVRHHVAVAHPPAESDWLEAAEHYRRLATDLGGRVGRAGGGAAALRLVAETANLGATLDATLEGPDPTSAVEATHALRDFARFSGADLTALFTAALAAARGAGDDRRTADLLFDSGTITLARSDHDGARARYEEALPLYRRVGHVLGEANCIQRLGDIAQARSDHDDARQAYADALMLYERIAEPYSIGGSHRRLARLARSESDRRDHFAAARLAWLSIGREDLVAKLDAEFDHPG